MLRPSGIVVVAALPLTSAPAAVAQEPTRRSNANGITKSAITAREIDGHLRFGLDAAGANDCAAVGETGPMCTL